MLLCGQVGWSTNCCGNDHTYKSPNDSVVVSQGKELDAILPCSANHNSIDGANDHCHDPKDEKQELRFLENAKVKAEQLQACAPLNLNKKKTKNKKKKQKKKSYHERKSDNTDREERSRFCVYRQSKEGLTKKEIDKARRTRSRSNSSSLALSTISSNFNKTFDHSEVASKAMGRNNFRGRGDGSTCHLRPLTDVRAFKKVTLLVMVSEVAGLGFLEWMAAPMFMGCRALVVWLGGPWYPIKGKKGSGFCNFEKGGIGMYKSDESRRSRSSRSYSSYSSYSSRSRSRSRRRHRRRHHSSSSYSLCSRSSQSSRSF